MRARRIHYGWVIAAITFLALLAAAGFRSTVFRYCPTNNPGVDDQDNQVRFSEP